MSTPEIERLARRAARARTPRRIQTANGVGYAATLPHLELQLCPSPLSAADSAAIKRVGGRYSECRGNKDVRFVHIPWTHAARSLVDDLLSRYALIRSSRVRSNIIFRGFPRVDDHIVQACTLAEAHRNFIARARRMHREGRLPRPLTAAERHARHVQSLLDRRAACLRGIEEVNAELAKLGIEAREEPGKLPSRA